jgi:KDO2-lipid IV(A) lauroyltransferase
LPLKVKWAYRIAKIIALFYFYIIRTGKKEILSNLRYVIKPFEERKKIAREIFINFAFNLVDFYRSFTLTSAELNQLVEIKNLSYLNQVFSQKKGVIVLTSHLGNWEIGGLVLASKKYPLTSFYLPFGHFKLNRFILELRVRRGIKLIPIGTFSKEPYRVLMRREILGIVGDRVISSADLKKVNFGEKKIYFPAGMIKLALKTNTPLIIGHCLRKKNKKYKLIFEKPVNPQNYTLEKLLQKYVSTLERYIRENPEQWFLFHHLKKAE